MYVCIIEIGGYYNNFWDRHVDAETMILGFDSIASAVAYMATNLEHRRNDHSQDDYDRVTIFSDWAGLLSYINPPPKRSSKVFWVAGSESDSKLLELSDEICSDVIQERTRIRAEVAAKKAAEERERAQKVADKKLEDERALYESLRAKFEGKS